jgi:hypothetical protein
MTRQSIMFGWAGPVAAVAVLAGFELQERCRTRPEEAEPYLARIQLLATMTPIAFDSWKGSEVPVPAAATSMLHPNVMISRQFTNRQSGRVVLLVLDQCADARDMAGHYPPNCYPGSGWVLEGREARTWWVDDWKINGTEYRFSRKSLGGRQRIVVDGFFIMPDGRFLPDMAQFVRAAGDFDKRHFGAAQMQLLFPEETLPAERSAVVGEFVRAHAEIIAAIRSGCRP